MCLTDENPHARESAVRIAGYFGYPECADQLLACCDDPVPAVQRAVLGHLACLDDARVVPRLLAALTASPDPRVRCAAAQALAGVEDSRTLEPLTAALADADPWVRYFAARALGEHRREAVLSDLTRLAFDDPAGQVRVAAVNALGRLATRAAVPALDALAASDDPDRAVAAIHALGGIRHADAWPPLQSALRAEGEAHRAAAAHAVARFGGPQAIEVLEWTAAADPSPAVVDAALEGLAAIAISSDDSESAVRVLVGLAADPARRDRVVSTLGGLPAPLIDAIARGLDDARVAVRVAVVRALSRMRQPEASRWLQSALDDASADVRVAALTELRHLGTRGIERRVAALARSDADPAVRRAALSALKGAALLEGGAAGESTASAER